ETFAFGDASCTIKVPLGGIGPIRTVRIRRAGGALRTIKERDSSYIVLNQARRLSRVHISYFTARVSGRFVSSATANAKASFLAVVSWPMISVSTSSRTQAARPT